MSKTEKISFFIVDEKGNPRSSEWIMYPYKDSFYVAVKNLSGHFKLSLHPVGKSEDGKDSQHGLVKKASLEIKKEGFGTPKLLRWNRPETNKNANLVANIVFPTDYLKGEVSTKKEEGKNKFVFPMAPEGHAVEIAVAYSLSEPDIINQVMSKQGYQMIFSVRLDTDELVAVGGRHALFDSSFLGTPEKAKFSELQQIAEGTEMNNLHAIFSNEPKDGCFIQLAEVNGINYKKKETKE